MSTRFIHLDERNAELRAKLDARPEVAAEFERRYQMSWYHHENGLDGIVLTEQELVQALEHHVVGDASLMSVLLIIRNHRAALELVRKEAKSRRSRVAVPFLVQLYETLLAGTNATAKEKAIFRKEMPIHRTYFHTLTQPDEIEAELEKAVKFTGTAEFRELHPLRQAALIHWNLMQVFPFAEHNGKIARLIQTLYLLRAGYEPAIILAVDRQRYYETLKSSPGALRNLLVESIENAMENAERFLAMGEARASGE